MTCAAPGDASGGRRCQNRGGKGGSASSRACAALGGRPISRRRCAGRSSAAAGGGRNRGTRISARSAAMSTAVAPCRAMAASMIASCGSGRTGPVSTSRIIGFSRTRVRASVRSTEKDRKAGRIAETRVADGLTRSGGVPGSDGQGCGTAGGRLGRRRAGRCEILALAAGRSHPAKRAGREDGQMDHVCPSFSLRWASCGSLTSGHREKRRKSCGPA